MVVVLGEADDLHSRVGGNQQTVHKSSHPYIHSFSQIISVQTVSTPLSLCESTRVQLHCEPKKTSRGQLKMNPGARSHLFTACLCFNSKEHTIKKYNNCQCHVHIPAFSQKTSFQSVSTP